MGVQKCQCYKTQKGAWNYSGFGELPMVYYSSCKAGAKERNFCFDITIQDMWFQFILQNRRCALTGMPLTVCRNYKLTRKNKDLMTASLDRIDSTKGYTKNNIQWVHKDINQMKMELDQKYFIKLCILIARKHLKHGI